VAEKDAARLLTSLKEAGVPAIEIGEVVAKTAPLIAVLA
jgi:hypothetical protein